MLVGLRAKVDDSLVSRSCHAQTLPSTSSQRSNTTSVWLILSSDHENNSNMAQKEKNERKEKKTMGSKNWIKESDPFWTAIQISLLVEEQMAVMFPLIRVDHRIKRFCLLREKIVSNNKNNQQKREKKKRKEKRTKDREDRKEKIEKRREDREEKRRSRREEKRREEKRREEKRREEKRREEKRREEKRREETSGSKT